MLKRWIENPNVYIYKDIFYEGWSHSKLSNIRQCIKTKFDLEFNMSKGIKLRIVWKNTFPECVVRLYWGDEGCWRWCWPEDEVDAPDGFALFGHGGVVGESFDLQRHGQLLLIARWPVVEVRTRLNDVLLVFKLLQQSFKTTELF